MLVTRDIESAFSDLSVIGWIAIVVIVIAGVVLIVAARRGFPRLVRRLCVLLSICDASATERELPGGAVLLARALVWLTALVVIVIMALALAMILALDTSGAVALLRGWGLAAGAWLLPRAIRLAILAVLTWIVLGVVRGALPAAVRAYLSRRPRRVPHRDDPESAKRSQTLVTVAVTVATWLIVTMALFVAFSELGFDIGPVLAGAGIIGLAIGFGAQNLVRDLLAGVYVLLEDQYRIGDVVEVAGKSGVVLDMSLRRTVLRDMDFAVHVIPNGEIKTTSNLTKGASRVNLDVEVGYTEPIDRCIAIIDRVGKEMFDEDFGGGAMREPLSVLRVERLGESSVVLKVLGETAPSKQWEVAGELRRRVKNAFDEEGVERPFPARTLYVRTQESSESRGREPERSAG